MKKFKIAFFVFCAILILSIPFIFINIGGKAPDFIREKIQKTFGNELKIDSIQIKGGKLQLNKVAYKDFFRAESLSIKGSYGLMLGSKHKNSASLYMKKCVIYNINIDSLFSFFKFNERKSAEINSVGYLNRNGVRLKFSATGKLISHGKKVFTLSNLIVTFPKSKLSFSKIEISHDNLTHFSGIFNINSDELKTYIPQLPVQSGNITIDGSYNNNANSKKGEFDLKSDKLIVQGITLTKIYGNASIMNNICKIKNLSMNLLNGSSIATGYLINGAEKEYNITVNTKDIDLNLINGKKSFVKFKGKYSGKLNFSDKSDSWKDLFNKLK